MQSYGLKGAHRTLNEAPESLDSGSGEEDGPATIDGNGDDVAAAVRRARSRAPVCMAAFPPIGCTREDEIKRRNIRHGEESMERKRRGNDRGSSTIAAIVFFAAGDGEPVEKSSEDALPRMDRHWNASILNVLIRLTSVDFTGEFRYVTVFRESSNSYPSGGPKCMMSIFSDMIEDIMEVFMDDFSVYGKTFGHCLQNLDKVLQRCQEKDLGKCYIGISVRLRILSVIRCPSTPDFVHLNPCTIVYNQTEPQTKPYPLDMWKYGSALQQRPEDRSLYGREVYNCTHKTQPHDTFPCADMPPRHTGKRP
uniref:Reverse transcriptase domain-containing protein n=1 Tax=Oryza sativa subsp. japonica TaxID=39947 RepID=Q9AYB3_ORYSJ|nr:Unknown protein [Oryza sativa Japonica Group]